MNLICHYGCQCDICNGLEPAPELTEIEQIEALEPTLTSYREEQLARAAIRDYPAMRRQFWINKSMDLEPDADRIFIL